MKTLIFGIILFLAVCPVVFGQTAANNCPEITVIGPGGITNPGDIMTFTASVNNFSGTDEIKYEWAVSAGTIEKGQGTSSIEVRTTKEMRDSNVTATVQIAGVDEGCAQTASDIGSIAAGIICGMPYDEFGRLSRGDTRARVDSFLIRLLNDPDSSALIIITLNERESRALKLSFLNNIYGWVEFRKFNAARIKFVVHKGPYDTEARVWLIPRGAETPVLYEGGFEIKGNEFKHKIKDLFKLKPNK